MDLFRLQGRADHAVQPCVLSGLGIVHDDLVDGLVDEQVLLHGLLVGGGQLGHGNQQGPGAVGPGQALQGGLHHGGGTGGMEVGDVYIQIPQDRHGLLDGVGDIVELQVQEDLVAPGLDLPDDFRPLGVVQLHADLHERLSAGELIQESKGLLRTGKIAGYDHVFTHYCAPPIISFKFSILYSFMARGRSSMMFLQAQGSTRLAAPTSTAVAPASIISITSSAD